MKATLTKAGKADACALRSLREAYPSLPEAYIRFLEASNGAEGDLGIEPGWVVIWSAEEAIQVTNQYQMPKYLPGYFAFGSNGGGELLVFPIDGGTDRCPVQMVPAIGMAAQELRSVAPSFAEFQTHLGRPIDADA
jgi:hypothetical protein